MKRLMLVATTALCAAGGTGALAQDSAGRAAGSSTTPWGIEEVVVTAQRRSESVQSVPIAISAFSSEQLAEKGITNALQLGNFVPNLVAQNNTGVGSANAYYLRGMGTAESIPTFDPPVGTYVDDIYLSRQNGNNLSMFDVERVEVLRGPQGTLFGRNTTGGAISIIMREPGDEYGGYGEVGYGSYNKRTARLSVDLPVADALAFKASGYWQNDDGYVKNVTTNQRLNDDDGWGLRFGLRADFGPKAHLTASYMHIAANGENILNFDCNPANPSDCDGRFATTGLREGKSAATSPYAPLVISGRKANFLMGNRSASDILTSKLSWSLTPDLKLDFITGYVAQTQKYALDFYDGRSGPSLSAPDPAVRGYTRGGFTILNDGENEQFTQEVKLNGSLLDGRIDFVSGLYYINETNDTDFADVFSLSQASALLLADRDLHNKTEAWAGYAQGDLKVTDKLKLTAGIRYTDEKKSFSIHDNRPGCNDGTIEATCLDSANLGATPDEQTAKMWTPRFAVNYQVDNILMFASATRGFKSGGWNARGSAIGTFVPFGPEKAWSYEAGVKSDWFDRRLRANVTVFHMDVADLQTPSAYFNANGSITFLTRNFADYANTGVEAEFTAVPVPGLNLFLNVGYQDDKYKIDRDAPAFDAYGIQSVASQQAACRAFLATGAIPTGGGACGAGIVTASGEIAEPVRTPDWTLAFGGSYEAEIGHGMTLVPSVTASYRTTQWVAASNYTIYSGAITGTNGAFPANPFGGDFINGAYSKAAWNVNAGLALNGPDDRWQVSLNCLNCLNEAAVNTSLANTTYINPPRTWLLKLRHDF